MIKLKQTTLSKIGRDAHKKESKEKCFGEMKDILRCRIISNNILDIQNKIEKINKDADLEVLGFKNGLNNKKVPIVFC